MHAEEGERACSGALSGPSGVKFVASSAAQLPCRCLHPPLLPAVHPVWLCMQPAPRATPRGRRSQTWQPACLVHQEGHARAHKHTTLLSLSLSLCVATQTRNYLLAASLSACSPSRSLDVSLASRIRSLTWRYPPELSSHSCTQTLSHTPSQAHRYTHIHPQSQSHHHHHNHTHGCPHTHRLSGTTLAYTQSHIHTHTPTLK